MGAGGWRRLFEVILFFNCLIIYKKCFLGGSCCFIRPSFVFALLSGCFES